MADYTEEAMEAAVDAFILAKEASNGFAADGPIEEFQRKGFILHCPEFVWLQEALRAAHPIVERRVKERYASLLTEAHNELHNLGGSLNMARLLMPEKETRDLAGEIVEDAAKVRAKIREALSDGS